MTFVFIVVFINLHTGIFKKTVEKLLKVRLGEAKISQDAVLLSAELMRLFVLGATLALVYIYFAASLALAARWLIKGFPKCFAQKLYIARRMRPKMAAKLSSLSTWSSFYHGCYCKLFIPLIIR